MKGSCASRKCKAPKLIGLVKESGIDISGQLQIDNALNASNNWACSPYGSISFLLSSFKSFGIQALCPVFSLFFLLILLNATLERNMDLHTWRIFSCMSKLNILAS